MSYRICSYCVMDTSDPDIRFNAMGHCNHCVTMRAQAAARRKADDYSNEKLRKLVRTMRAAGKDKPYDCILGVSGGVDSSYLCHLLHHLRLRPLLIHFDNGWNTALAEYNIRILVERFGFDYMVSSMDLDEFFELQRAYMRASVIDIEVLTDQALTAAIYQEAQKHQIKYVITGSNFSSEAFMPPAWAYTKWDIVNIKAICEQYARCEIKTYPVHGTLSVNSKFVTVDLLNYFDFNKEEAMSFLEREYGWQRYRGKHYESLFTKFYQAYILPVKFGVDKRRAHLSSLIISQQLNRSAALAELEKPLYPEEELREDKRMVLEKLNLTEEEFDAIMQAKPVPHRAFAHSTELIELARAIKSYY